MICFFDGFFYVDLAEIADNLDEFEDLDDGYRPTVSP